MDKERNFHALVEKQWEQQKFLCIGLDPYSNRLPAEVQSIVDPHTRLVTWAKEIIAATKDVAAAYKPNPSFFEAYGSAGIAAMEEICRYIHDIAPESAIILDAKRGDIETTNEGAAQFAFDVCGADAITVQPYMGESALEPFLRRAEKGVIVLCRTSNPGATEFQDAILRGTEQPLYDIVALRVSDAWNRQGNCWLVVGATAPEECAQLRRTYTDIPFLIPGVGAQGGDLEETITASRRADGKGFLMSISRAILFASEEAGYAGMSYGQAAGKAAHAFNERIKQAVNA